MLEAASRSLWSSFSSAIRFLFSDLTCFIVENVLSHKYVLPNINQILLQNLSVWKTYLY